MASLFSYRIHGISEIMAQTIINPVVRRAAVVRGLRLGGALLEAGLKSRIPVRTGQTRSRVNGRLSVGQDSISYIVGLKSIAKGFDIGRAMEEGTGLYGPRHQVIRPIHAKALRWSAGASPVTGSGGHFRFARWVRGMKPTRPFSRTMQEDGPKAGAAFKHVIVQAMMRNAGKH